MSDYGLLERVWALVAFWGYFAIAVGALLVYLETRKRIVLPLVVSSSCGALATFIPWFLNAAGSSLSTSVDHYTQLVLGGINNILWPFAVGLLLRELFHLWKREAPTKPEAEKSSESEGLQ